MMMPQQLQINLGQCSEAGCKDQNEDFFGAMLPPPESQVLLHKGLALAIADGMSGCEGGKEASQISVRMFLEGYYDTPDSWSVKNAVHKVIVSINRWLYSHGQYQAAKGMVTTFSALIMKSRKLYIFHVGDSRIYRLRDGQLRQLSRDHRLVIEGDREYLSRALGIDVSVDIDYREADLQIDDIYLLTTDGIHDFLTDEQIKQHLNEIITMPAHSNLDELAKNLVKEALAHKSNDNLTVQLCQITHLPEANQTEYYEQLTKLPFPPDLKAGNVMDGYKIVRELNATSRSQVYLAIDTLDAEQSQRVIKTPSVNFEDDPGYIELFLREEWVAKRLKSDHLIKVCPSDRKRQFLYTVLEYIQGQTLRQWMNDNPKADISLVRASLSQIIRGLRCMHRMEMIHQDLKPDNILIDKNKTLKIIDFGSTKIAGISEINSPIHQNNLLGTANYSAPEYFHGNSGSNRSDIYSLGVITYEMLTGKLPYGEISVENAAKKKFDYQSARLYNTDIPNWVDVALEKAVHPNPAKRYELLSEFLYDLNTPNQHLLNNKIHQPLLQRNPLAFWQGLVVIEAFIILLLLAAI